MGRIRRLKKDIAKVARDIAPGDSKRLKSQIKVSGNSRRIEVDYSSVPYVEYLNNPKNRNPKYRSTEFKGKPLKDFINVRTVAGIITKIEDQFIDGASRKASNKAGVRVSKKGSRASGVLKKRK